MAETYHKHEATDIHVQGATSIRVHTNDGHPFVAVRAGARCTAHHYKTHGGSEVRVDTEGEARLFLDLEQALILAHQLLRACSDAERHHLAPEEAEPYPDHTSDRRAIERQEAV